MYRIACMTTEIIIPSDITQTNTSQSLLKWDEAIKNTETKVENGACQGVGEERIGSYC